MRVISWVVLGVVGLIVLGLGLFAVTAVRRGLPRGVGHGEIGDLSQRWSKGKCEGQGPVTLGTLPLALADIEFIEPMGAMTPVHVTPTDHQYWRPIPWNIEQRPRDVFAPADGAIVLIERQQGVSDYRLIIEHSCTFYTEYIHITELDAKISSQLSPIKPGSSEAVRVNVEEGQLLGTIFGQDGAGEWQIYQLDFSVVNTETTLAGLFDPERYRDEAGKIHIDEPYQYFTKLLQQQLAIKSLRSVAPLGGKFDYDVAGSLSGNWFREGSSGYAGTGGGLYRYANHLAFAYDYIDPSTVIISIGDWAGESQQFGILGNGPDPKTVDVSEGPVKYELVSTEYIDAAGKRWDRRSFAANLKAVVGDRVAGVVLVQLLGDRQLKVETFVGKRAAQVGGFTGAAEIFER